MSDSVIESEKRMKLFVAGQVSGDPAEWSEWMHTKLVIAESEEQALSMTDESHFREVRMDRPAVL